MSCLIHAAQLERERIRLESLGVQIIGIGPSDDASAERVRKLFSIGYQLFGDRRAAVYSAFGYKKVLAVVRQSGAVLVGRDGKVRYLFRTANPHDALKLAEITTAIES